VGVTVRESSLSVTNKQIQSLTNTQTLSFIYISTDFSAWVTVITEIPRYRWAMYRVTTESIYGRWQRRTRNSSLDGASCSPSDKYTPITVRSSTISRCIRLVIEQRIVALSVYASVRPSSSPRQLPQPPITRFINRIVVVEMTTSRPPAFIEFPPSLSPPCRRPGAVLCDCVRSTSSSTAAFCCRGYKHILTSHRVKSCTLRMLSVPVSRAGKCDAAIPHKKTNF